MSTPVLSFIKTGVFTRLKAASNYLFSKHLMATNVAISVSLSGLGDAIMQHYEIITGDLECWNKRRTSHMSISGLTVGIVVHHWYRILDKALPGRTIGVVVRKVIIDQCIGSPLSISTFFGTLAIVERSSWERFKCDVKLKAWRLYAAEWIVWPPAQIINFYFLPTKYRVLYDNTISLGYDIYTSHVRHDNQGECDEKPVDKILDKS